LSLASLPQEESQALRRAVACLSYLLQDLEETEDDRNPETGEVYASHAEARDALAELERVASHWLP
jgi:hypothetical protein